MFPLEKHNNGFYCQDLFLNHTTFAMMRSSMPVYKALDPLVAMHPFIKRCRKVRLWSLRLFILMAIVRDDGPPLRQKVGKGVFIPPTSLLA